MGKAARWFRSFLGKKDQAKDQRRQREDHQPLPSQASAKRWSFGKSSRDTAEAAAASQVPVAAGNAAIARAAEAAWLRSAVKAPLPSPSVKADAAALQLAVAAAGPPPAMAAAVLDLAPVVNREGEVSGE